MATGKVYTRASTSATEGGDAVSAGQVSGLMGLTGKTIWAHVYFHVWRQSLNPRIGFLVDPVLLLQRPPGLIIGLPQCGD